MRTHFCPRKIDHQCNEEGANFVHQHRKEVKVDQISTHISLHCYENNRHLQNQLFIQDIQSRNKRISITDQTVIESCERTKPHTLGTAGQNTETYESVSSAEELDTSNQSPDPVKQIRGERNSIELKFDSRI